MNKKLVSLAMAAMLLFSVNVSAYASEVSENRTSGSGIHIMLVNTDDVSASLNFSGSCAVCSGIVDGKSGTNKISVTGILRQTDNNRTIKVWAPTVYYGDTAYYSQNYSVTSGHTYEFELIATVYRNGTSEVVTAVDSQYCG